MKKYIISFTVCICASVFPILAQNLHVVFIGNSITQGVQLKDAKHEAPPAQAALFLQEHIKGTVEFRNCGRSGRTTLNFLPVTNTEFPKVLAAADELASKKGVLLFSIMLGTNDSAVRGPLGAPVHPVSYYTNVQAIVDALLDRYPKALVVLHRPTWYSPNTYNSSTYLAEGLKRLQSYSPMLDKLVEHYAVTSPDRVFLGDTLAFDYFKENHLTHLIPESGQAGTFYLHPNKSGARELGSFWSEAILRCLPGKMKK